MKSFLVALLAVVFLFPIYSFAQNNKYQWEKLEIDFEEIQGTQYYLEIHNANCAINVYPDGKLEVYAHDYRYPDKNSTLSQYKIIEPSGKSVQGFWSTKGNYYRESRGYDIFAKKFKKYAINLPPEVRTMFKGHWKIK